MKTRYLYILLALTITGFRAKASTETINISTNDTLIVICAEAKLSTDSIQVQTICLCDESNKGDKQFSYSDGVSTLTLIINTINNLYTRDNLFLAFLSLMVAIMGFFGFRSIKSVKKDVKGTLPKLKKEAYKLKKENEKIDKAQSLNNQYLQSINQCMLSNADAIAEATGADSQLGKNLKKRATVNYYLMKLYLSTDRIEIDECIYYIKNQGGEDEIIHLQFIVDNDPNKYKRDKASEAIGYIRARLVH